MRFVLKFVICVTDGRCSSSQALKYLAMPLALGALSCFNLIPISSAEVRDECGYKPLPAICLHCLHSGSFTISTT